MVVGNILQRRAPPICGVLSVLLYTIYGTCICVVSLATGDLKCPRTTIPQFQTTPLVTWLTLVPPSAWPGFSAKLRTGVMKW